ncbi:histidine kinase [Aphanothece hegewaldii CCALA 016]|uniref:histidine kinase n=1 Tax=Aphanothece hegewaldii CCALA 016 TaxID=2107694 RepID=A0A2T1LTT5_9CHRO|nr:GAF domain-containing sensor histidine kinase [Aphanothece hegewaldii]PSF34535.1 histidine kinase [Aphanothece hegewaldii CCALA 016]
MQGQKNNSGVEVNMPNPMSRLFCRLDGLTPDVREQQRVNKLKNFGLLETDTVPVFDEATQMAARFLGTPICILGMMVYDNLWLKSAVGLSQLGLMNQIASSRKIIRIEAFCTYVVDSEQVLLIDDTYSNVVFAGSLLTQHYNIRSYLGTPLVTSEGQCIGTLAVMDLIPRQFTIKDLEFLTLTARWCLREFERDYLAQTHSSLKNELLNLKAAKEENTYSSLPTEQSTAKPELNYSIGEIKLRLLRGLIQELRTPLTSVIGMSSILHSEVFGQLSSKQKDYLKIIHESGNQMTSLVDEIIKLGTIEENNSQLDLTPVNVEMICQQILNDLSEIAQQKRQDLRLSVEPGKGTWLLDKDKIKQALYYLIISVLESSESGGEVRVHISRRNNTLNIAIWVSHPWLGDGLPQITFHPSLVTNGLSLELETLTSVVTVDKFDSYSENQVISTSSIEANLNRFKEINPHHTQENPQALLGLLLGCYLAENHGGKIMVQGSPESGYRYVLMLPKIAVDEV